MPTDSAESTEAVVRADDGLYIMLMLMKLLQEPYR